MESVHRSNRITCESNPDTFVYDILSEGHLQATAHRLRSYSIHTSRYSSRETKVQTKRFRKRRMSMPPNGTRLPRDYSNEPKDLIIEQLKGLTINEGKEFRRASSFEELSETGQQNLRRVRSFKTSSKGLINHSDSINMRNNSDFKRRKSSEKNSKTARQNFFIPRLLPSKYRDDQRNFKVLLTGAGGVGKTSLIQQFMTPEYQAQSEGERTVSLQVDGGRVYIRICTIRRFSERTTFDIAIDLLIQIREEVGSNKAIILVGNKSDLVRKRTISQEEGRSAADAYSCKYIELSAALSHRVDELLVGIHKQIKLKSDADKEFDSKIPKRKERKSSFKRTKQFLEKVFLGHTGKDKKTENLYVE